MGPISIYHWLTVQGLSENQWQQDRPWVQGGKKHMWFAPYRVHNSAPLWLRYDAEQGHFEAPWIHPGYLDLIFTAPLWLASWSALENYWLEHPLEPQKTWEGALQQAEGLLKTLNPEVAQQCLHAPISTQGWEEASLVFWAQKDSKQEQRALEVRLQNLLEAKLFFEEKYRKHLWSSWFVGAREYEKFIAQYLPAGEWKVGGDLQQQMTQMMKEIQACLEAPQTTMATYRPPLLHTLCVSQEEPEQALQEALLSKVPTQYHWSEVRVEKLQLVSWMGPLTQSLRGYYAQAEIEAVAAYPKLAHSVIVTLTPAQATEYKLRFPEMQILSVADLLYTNADLTGFEQVIFCSLLTENISLTVSRLYDEYAFLWPFILNLHKNLVVVLDKQCLDVRLHHATGKLAQWMEQNPSVLTDESIGEPV